MVIGLKPNFPCLSCGKSLLRLLGDVPRSGKPKNGSGTEGLEEAQPGEKPLGAAMRKIGAEEGWTLVKRSRTDKVERTRSIGPH